MYYCSLSDIIIGDKSQWCIINYSLNDIIDIIKSNIEEEMYMDHDKIFIDFTSEYVYFVDLYDAEILECPDEDIDSDDDIIIMG